MNLEKILYLINLTKDSDISLVDTVVDFYNDDSGYNLVVKNKSNISDVYITYSLKVDEEDNELFHINKSINDIESDVSYSIKLKNIIDRHFGDLFVNSNRVIRYEFNDDILNKNNVSEWEIISYYDYYEQKHSSIGR